MLSYLITYGLMLFYFSAFFIAVSTCYKNGGGQLKDILSGQGEPGILFIRLLAGFFFLGIGTVSIYEQKNLSSEFFMPALNSDGLSIWGYIAVAAIIVGIISALRKSPSAVGASHSLPFYILPAYILIRTLFLIVYEFFFRGAMLFAMIEDMGIAVAIIINIILYVLVHWFDKKERYGSIFMGIILCIVTIHYQSVWPAIIIHLSLALSHEIILLINNKSLLKKPSL